MDNKSTDHLSSAVGKSIKRIIPMVTLMFILALHILSSNVNEIADSTSAANVALSLQQSLHGTIKNGILQIDDDIEMVNYLIFILKTIANDINNYL